jgi:hypothetical protein
MLPEGEPQQRWSAAFPGTMQRTIHRFNDQANDGRTMFAATCGLAEITLVCLSHPLFYSAAGALERIGATGRRASPGSKVKRWSSEYQGAAKPNSGAGSSWRI